MIQTLISLIKGQNKGQTSQGQLHSNLSDKLKFSPCQCNVCWRSNPQKSDYQTNLIPPKVVLLFLPMTILFTPAIGWALTVEAVPNPRQLNGTWVTDLADLLTPTAENNLNQIIDQLERKNGVEIAIVTVPETAPAPTPKEFTTNLFNYWKIGKQGKNNGVLMLVSVSDRRVEIETGQGLQKHLPNAEVSNLIKTYIIPYFRQQNYEMGVVNGTQALVNTLQNYPKLSEAKSEFNWQDIAVGSTLLGAGGWALSGLVKHKSRPVLKLKPEGRSRLDGPPEDSTKIKICCAVCGHNLNPLPESEVTPYLTPQEAVAQEIKSLKLIGFECPRCRPKLIEMGIHIRGYVQANQRFAECPKCEEITMTCKEKITLAPTWDIGGKKLVAKSCHYCQKYAEVEEEMPPLPIPHNAIVLPSVGQTRMFELKPVHCQQCHYPMRQTSLDLVTPLLTKAEKIAKEIGSTQYTGWQCDRCHPTPNTHDIQIYEHILLSDSFAECSYCHEFTVMITRRTEPATYYTTGREIIIKECRCCGDRQNVEHIIPMIPQAIVSHSYSSSSSSDSSSSSSSSSFGGGSSDGGGSGESW